MGTGKFSDKPEILSLSGGTLNVLVFKATCQAAFNFCYFDFS